MKILAIDPSSTILGWAVMDSELEDKPIIAHGIIDCRKVDYDSRFMFLTGQIHNIWKQYTIEEIAIEEMFKNPKYNTAALKVAEMSIRKWVEKMVKLGHPIVLSKYAPGVWKKSVLGHGNATKDEIIQYMYLLFCPAVLFCLQRLCREKAILPVLQFFLLHHY